MSHFLESERTKLRTVRKDDLNVLAELMSDREIASLCGEVYPVTEKSLDEFYQKCQTTQDRIWFVVIDRKTDTIIGETGFLRIFMPWRTADYSLIIWNRAHWNKGYGKEIASLMLDYGFNDLNFHRLAIGVVANNKRAVRFWKSIGFVEEGKQIDGYYTKGEYSDFVMMSLLEQNFRKRTP